MSVMIESTDELLKVLRKMNLKVGSVDELRQLLASINASYNPDAARQNTGKQIGTFVPLCMTSSAAIVSMFITPSIGGLAVIWGSVALASTSAVISAAIMTRVCRGRTIPDHSPTRPASLGGPAVTHITKELAV